MGGRRVLRRPVQDRMAKMNGEPLESTRVTVAICALRSQVEQDWATIKIEMAASRTGDPAPLGPFRSLCGC